ncbi:rod shape-determining protein RodA [Gilvimarinus sp. F26214L]|uniref:rod shape-determining protein RodA n=1 Tax=Gilvimarinus sp. DZF01 TaxID=3461371 RepID=UPI00404685CC
MADQDFLRRLPEASRDLARRGSVWMRLHIDLPLLILLMLLSVAGLVVLYSASSESIYLVKRQATIFLLGFAGMFVVAQVRLSTLARWSIWAWVLGVFLLVLVIFFGVGAKGAQRWLSFGGMRFQPSELMKIALPVVTAAYLSQRQIPPRFKHVVWSLVFIATPAILILQQPDLGTSILVAFSGLVVLFLAGLPWAYIVGALTALAASAWPIWEYGLRDYQRQRILTLLNPEADKLGAGWNIIQSKTAIGSGGVSGKGWMQGTQSHLDFLPEGHTDFIIAVLAEEFGLFGVLALLGVYLLIIGRGLAIAMNAQDSFGRLLAGSLTLTFFIYVFVNMGMVAGLLPVVGVPLPLVSYGGTAMLTLMIGFGLLMAISTEQRRLTI